MTDANIIDADIRWAWTLPSSFYTDAERFEPIRSIFKKTWQFGAHISEFESHNIIPLNPLESITGESLCLAHGENTLSLSNVCTHRGMRLVEKECKAQSLQCPYHGRTFNLRGGFTNMPDFEQVENFPSPEDDLSTFPLTEWKGLFFTGLEPREKPPLDYLNERFGWLDIASFRHDSEGDRDYEIEANWALYVDNYLEGFHIPYVHPELHQTLEHADYSVECFTGGVLQVGVAKQGEPCFDLPDNSLEYGKRIGAYYLWLFPNTMLNFYPWGLSVNIVIPISVGRTRVVYRRYVGNPSMLGEGAGGDLDRVEMQDQWIVEAVQRGMRSSSYERGRYSPTKERGVHHFHRLLGEQF